MGYEKVYQNFYVLLSVNLYCFQIEPKSNGNFQSSAWNLTRIKRLLTYSIMRNTTTTNCTGCQPPMSPDIKTISQGVSATSHQRSHTGLKNTILYPYISTYFDSFHVIFHRLFSHPIPPHIQSDLYE